MRLSARPGFPALLIGCVTLADLTVARALLRANEAHVWIAGRAFDFGCAFRDATGIPCLMCGMTRSVAMSLHGEFARAWAIAPGGPVAVVGLAAFAFGLLAMSLIEARGRQSAIHASRTWFRNGALVYAAALAAVWLGGWAHAIAAALTG